MEGRLPPYSEEAERGTLGSMIQEPERVVPHVRGDMGVKAEMFYVPAHRKVCAGIYAVCEKRQGRMDLILLSEYLQHEGQLDQIGGEIFLRRLIEETPTTAHAIYYADIVLQKALLRGVIEKCRETENDAYEAERADSLLLELPQRFADVAGPAMQKEEQAGALLDRFVNKCKANYEIRMSGGVAPLPGLETPWPWMNKALGGLQEGLIVLAGRPGAGKTSMADHAVSYLLGKGTPIAVASLDLSTEKWMSRTACRMAGVSLPKALGGYANQAQMADLVEAKEVIERYPLYIWNGPRDVESICGRTRLLKIKHDVKLLVVDHLQAAQVSSTKKLFGRYEEMTYISGMLKDLAMELGIPVMALSQLSRAFSAQGKLRDPILTDLRDSGAIEQDAAVAVLVYPDLGAQKDAFDALKEGDVDSFNEWKKKKPSWAEVAKHQQGDTGKQEFWFRTSYFRFDEAAKGFYAVEAGAGR